MAASDTQLSFRRASAEDVDQLVELRIRQLLDEGYPESRDIREDLSTYFSKSLENGSLICWVGVTDEVIQATAAICFYQLPPTFSNPSGRIAYITNMYTDPLYRRRGTALQLLEKLVLEARALNYAGVRLHASELGRGVYKRAGFVDLGGYMAKRLS